MMFVKNTKKQIQKFLLTRANIIFFLLSVHKEGMRLIHIQTASFYHFFQTQMSQFI